MNVLLKGMSRYAILFCITIQCTCCSKTDSTDVVESPPVKKVPVKVILDTDMCFDVDDVGALATLNVLADMDEADILAVCYDEVNKDGAAAIDAINTWYKRGNVPIGIYKKSLSSPDSSPYLSYIAAYSNDIPKDLELVPNALDLYVKTLEAQPDSSVTIISVGFLNNLGDLMDGHSDLIARKVKELVIMGGINNDDFNLSRHDLVGTSEKVLRDWPTPIVISQIGGEILTGETLASTPTENPVREAYFRWFNNDFKGRSSWDLIAVLYAVRGLSYFSLNSMGEGSLVNGYSYGMKEGWRSYITKELSNDEYAQILNTLLTKPPKTAI
ncbi:nucleoside hydrolase [Flavobacteriaceae bacterium F89]|uniref:Nucleoside hydrolase n=1 Tax=Cerina litoralis TaxID=2874477 RepID=A0AAE3EZE7_9FLAO|nr:nucleoside hydrolase [Cerina litoralis]MCG2462502.1 nucleoside hydrolase [Cerina litoralis]